jgi:hypothetical protein
VPRYGSQFRSVFDTSSQVEVYRNAQHRERCLRHRVSSGRHVILVEYPLLERPKAEVYVVPSTGEARDVWTGLRAWLAREEYGRVMR